MAVEDKASLPRLVLTKAKEYGIAAVQRYRKFNIYQKVRTPVTNDTRKRRSFHAPQSYLSGAPSSCIYPWRRPSSSLVPIELDRHSTTSRRESAISASVGSFLPPSFVSGVLCHPTTVLRQDTYPDSRHLLPTCRRPHDIHNPLRLCLRHEGVPHRRGRVALWLRVHLHNPPPPL